MIEDINKTEHEEETTEEPKKILRPSFPVLSETNTVLSNGQVEICRVDENGTEILNSEFVTSLRMWDQVYSQDKQFKIKKKL